MDRNELICSLTRAQKENARLRGVLARLVKAITKVDHPTMTTDRKAYAEDRKAYAELVEAHFQGQLVEVTGERAPSADGRARYS
jgi:hypothetical protein